MSSRLLDSNLFSLSTIPLSSSHPFFTRILCTRGCTSQMLVPAHSWCRCQVSRPSPLSIPVTASLVPSIKQDSTLSAKERVTDDISFRLGEKMYRAHVTGSGPARPANLRFHLHTHSISSMCNHAIRVPYPLGVLGRLGGYHTYYERIMIDREFSVCAGMMPDRRAE
jgi:hypothetical protein